tara:strand:- start:1408 stop:3063 length:1656 start_codon:yes stop_codon:yes gene_type:complete
MKEHNLRDLFKEHVDEYNLTSFVDGSLVRMVASFVQSYSLKTSSNDLDIRDIIIDVGGSELLMSTEFCRWLYSVIPNEYQFQITAGERNRLEETKKKVSKSFLRKMSRLFKEYGELLFHNPQIRTKEDFLKIIPFTGLKPLDFTRANEKIFLNLHYYQQAAKYELFEKLILNRDPSALLQLPTGAGKTKTAVEFLVDYLRSLNSLSSNRRRIVWISHSSELCQQSKDSFIQCWKYRGDRGINVIEYFGNTNIKMLTSQDDNSDSIVFASFQKLHSLLNRSIIKFNEFFEDTSFIVIDEAHISTAPTYLDVLNHLKSFSNSCKLLGLTATPGRSKSVSNQGENRFLSDIYSNNLVTLRDSAGYILEEPIAYLQQKEYLAQMEFKVLEITSKAESGSEKNVLLENGDRNFTIVLQTKELLRNSKKVMLFAGSVEHARFLNRVFKYFNIKSESIDSDMKRFERNTILNDFKNGELELLINFGVLSTGVDVPNLEAVVIARPITSIVLFSQIIGRALRGPKNGGREKNIILTVKDNVIGSPDFIYKYWEENWINN